MWYGYLAKDTNPDLLKKQNEITQSDNDNDDNDLPPYGPPYHDSDIIHHTAKENNIPQGPLFREKTKVSVFMLQGEIQKTSMKCLILQAFF